MSFYPFLTHDKGIFNSFHAELITFSSDRTENIYELLRKKRFQAAFTHFSLSLIKKLLFCAANDH